jgi:microcystin degradation protein MlrC
MKALVLQCFHESNVFSPIRNGLDDFRKRYFIEGAAVQERFMGTKTWLGGILGVLAESGVETRIGTCVASHPGGIVEATAYDVIKTAILGSLEKLLSAGAVDAVIFLLHGAMAVDGVHDPEGDLLREARSMVGEYVTIACTVDFHANVSPGVAAVADLIVGGREYPHVDTFERGCITARLALEHACGGRMRTWSFRLPLVTALAMQSTVVSGPMLDIRQALGAIQERYHLADLAFLAGFPYIDAPWVGSGVLVTGDNADLAVAAFLEISRLVMRHRQALTASIPDIGQVIPEVLVAVQHGTVVLADTGDNPGAGGTGDDVTVLRTLLGSPALFSAGLFIDPQVCREAAQLGSGGRLNTRLGGRHGNGPGLEIDALVKRTGPLVYRNSGPMMTGEVLDGGLAAVLEVSNGYILVGSERIQLYDTEGFVCQDVPISGNRIIAIKSTVHFRAAYTPLANAGIFMVDSLGWSSSRLAGLGHRHVDPRWFDGVALADEDWEAEAEREIIRVFGLRSWGA